MRILVTGSNGHVGGQVVRDLLQRGHDVVALVREGADLSSHEGLRLNHAKGDVLDSGAVDRAAQGCEAIIHLAAVYKLGARDPDSIIVPAVKGSENVLRAAKRERARVVQCSSTFAVGFSTRPETRDETCWNERLDDPYAAAKTQAERRSLTLAAELGVDVVTINPTAIIGHLDYRCTPSHDILVSMARIPSAFPGGACFADVRDVSHILCEALTRGVPGERYIVSSDNVTIDKLLAHITSRTGKMVLSSPLPRSVVLPFWRGMSTMLGWVGARMPLDTAVIDEFYDRWAWYDNAKARKTFGWTPTPLSATLDSALSWAVERGWVRGGVAKAITKSLAAAGQTDARSVS